MNNRALHIAAAAVATLAALSGNAFAAGGDSRIEAAKLCTQYIPFYERQYGVPSHLISAISSAESGRWHDDLRIALPYPWAINAEGKAFYFNSKAEAIAGVKKLQSQGVKSIDIGCMQVNLIHHANAFANLEQAFDPKTNIAYGASFLRNLYESEGSWRKATAAYHSKTPGRGSTYASRVFRSWETIISRLRLPKSDTLQQADAGFDGRDIAVEPAKSSIVKNTSPSTTTAMLSVDKASERPGPQPIKMKVINVSDSSAKRGSGIMVFKPRPSIEDSAQVEEDLKPITIASADNAKTLSAPNAKIVRLNGGKTNTVKYTNLSQPTTSNLKTSSGPRFIFSD